MAVSTRNVDGPIPLRMCIPILFQLFDSMSRLSFGRQSRVETQKRPYEK
jgi:hypothetical protein